MRCSDVPSSLHSAASSQSNPSSEDVLHHFAEDIGEAEVAALEPVGEPLVVDAHEMHEGGLKIVDVDFVHHGIHAEIVGRAIGQAGLHAAGPIGDGL